MDYPRKAADRVEYGERTKQISLFGQGCALHLALPNELREISLDKADFRSILRAFQVRLIFFNPQGEVVLEWIETLTTELL